MFKKWGWYVVAVISAMMAAFWSSGVHAAPGGTSMSVTIHSTIPGPAHNSAPRMHEGPNSHPPHQHYHGHGGYNRPRPHVYVQPPARIYQECQRYDGWRQQYIYVPC